MSQKGFGGDSGGSREFWRFPGDFGKDSGSSWEFFWGIWGGSRSLYGEDSGGSRKGFWGILVVSRSFWREFWEFPGVLGDFGGFREILGGSPGAPGAPELTRYHHGLVGATGEEHRGGGTGDRSGPIGIERHFRDRRPDPGSPRARHFRGAMTSHNFPLAAAQGREEDICSAWQLLTLMISRCSIACAAPTQVSVLSMENERFQYGMNLEVRGVMGSGELQTMAGSWSSHGHSHHNLMAMVTP